jgi:hypothetical protein
MNGARVPNGIRVLGFHIKLLGYNFIHNGTRVS